MTVVGNRPILSVNIVSQFQSSTLGQNYRTLQGGLSAIAELLVHHVVKLICVGYYKHNTLKFTTTLCEVNCFQ